jgi:hypothetical protein
MISAPRGKRLWNPGVPFVNTSLRLCPRQV